MRLLSLLLLGLSWCGSCAFVAPHHGRLLVGSDLDNLPFAGVSSDGHPIGRDVEMMQMLCDRAGYELCWSRMPFEQLLPKVEAGRVDVVCATLGITAERSQRVIFSPSYFDTTIVAVVRNGDRALQMLADLNGKLVSGASGTTSELAIRRSLPGARGVFKNKTGGSALFRLMSREIDAAVMDGPAADSLVSQAAGQLRRMPEPLAVESYALALPRTHTEISARLATALLAMKRSGELADLDRKYGLSEN